MRKAIYIPGRVAAKQHLQILQNMKFEERKNFEFCEIFCETPIHFCKNVLRMGEWELGRDDWEW